MAHPVLVGKVVHKGEEFEGEHEAIIDPETFLKVQTLLKSNGRGGGAEARNKYGALLRGLLRCKGCDCAMTHTFSSARGGKRYRYYRCVRAIKSGADACSSGSLPALKIERLVLDEVRGLARDKKLVGEVLAESQAVVAGELTALRAERDDLARELTRQHRDLRRLATKGDATSGTTARIADLNARISGAERRRPELDSRIAELEQQTITGPEAKAAFADFDGLWASLSPREQARLLGLVVSAVEYDGVAGSVSVTFHPTSIRALARQRQEAA